MNFHWNFDYPSRSCICLWLHLWVLNFQTSFCHCDVPQRNQVLIIIIRSYISSAGLWAPQSSSLLTSTSRRTLKTHEDRWSTLSMREYLLQFMSFFRTILGATLRSSSSSFSSINSKQEPSMELSSEIFMGGSTEVLLQVRKSDELQPSCDILKCPPFGLLGNSQEKTLVIHEFKFFKL